MKRLLFTCCLLVLISSCSNQDEELTAQQIINRTIENAGGDNFEKAEIDFRFREGKYKSIRDGGEFRLERQIADSTGTEYHDVLHNEGFTRYHQGEVVSLKDSMKTLYSNSVNSVHYFLQLPYGLNAEAVNKQLLGKDSIKGKEYYEIEVSFDVENGGDDYEDEYLYWISTADFTVDYLAYSFEMNEGGIRFRKAYNPRRVGGIRFVDYENYSYEDLSTPLHRLDSLYEAGELTLLSIIENEEIEVKLLD